jgi:hypothetical protein
MAGKVALMSSMMPGPAISASEFSALIYGSLVSSLLDMVEDTADVNAKLDELGYRIGLRLAHDFARERKLERVETPSALISEVIIRNWQNTIGQSAARFQPVGDDSFTIQFETSAFTRHVRVPDSVVGLKYPAMLPGVLRGIFEIFHYRADVRIVDDPGSGTVVRVDIKERIPVAVAKDED